MKKQQILAAAFTVLGGITIFGAPVQAHDHDHDFYGRRGMPYGYYNNGYYGQRNGFIKEMRRDRRQAIRSTRRAVRHWDRRLNRWF